MPVLINVGRVLMLGVWAFFDFESGAPVPASAEYLH